MPVGSLAATSSGNGSMPHRTRHRDGAAGVCVTGQVEHLAARTARKVRSGHGHRPAGANALTPNGRASTGEGGVNPARSVDARSVQFVARTSVSGSPGPPPFQVTAFAVMRTSHRGRALDTSPKRTGSVHSFGRRKTTPTASRCANAALSGHAGVDRFRRQILLHYCHTRGPSPKGARICLPTSDRWIGGLPRPAAAGPGDMALCRWDSVHRGRRRSRSRALTSQLPESSGPAATHRRTRSRTPHADGRRTNAVHRDR